MMTRSISRGAAALLLACSTAYAAPIVDTPSPTDLIGHTLDFVRAYPSQNTPYGLAIPSTTVVDGTSDAVQWRLSAADPVSVTIDPDADRITLSFLQNTGYVTLPNVFDGYIISGFDYDIASVSVLSNSTFYTANLTYDLRSIALDLSGQSAPGNLVLALTLAPTSAVPEPSSLALAATAFAGLALTRRRRR